MEFADHKPAQDITESSMSEHSSQLDESYEHTLNSHDIADSDRDDDEFSVNSETDKSFDHPKEKISSNQED